MLKNRKNIIVLCVCVILAISVTVAVNIYNSRKMQIKKCDEALESTIDTTSSYIILNVKKEDFTDISSKKFIDLTQPTLDQYDDKQYVTFAFEDGTGISFTSANIYYGEIDETGTVTNVYGKITIENQQVTYEEVDNNEINGPVVIRGLMDDVYVSEDTTVYYGNGIFHVSVANVNKSVDEIVSDFCNYFKESGLTFDSAHLIIDNEFAYEINQSGSAEKTVLSDDF